MTSATRPQPPRIPREDALLILRALADHSRREEQKRSAEQSQAGPQPRGAARKTKPTQKGE